MIADKDLPQGTRVIPSTSHICDNAVPAISTGGGTSFKPIVPPVLLLSERRSRCSYCFRKLRSLEISINDFFHYFYCSMECQKNDYTLNSELVECIKKSPLFRSSDANTVVTPVALLLYRIIALIYREESSNKKISPTRNAMNQLIPNDEDKIELSNDEIRYRQHVAQCTIQLFKHTHNIDFFSMDELCRMISRIIYNGFSITESTELKTVGLGVYPCASIVNHSCVPNLVQTFEFTKEAPPTLGLTSCRFIKANEEMCISYTNALDTYSKREEFCLKEYKFLCDCKRCTKGRMRKAKNGNNGDSVTTNDSIQKDYDIQNEVLYCTTKGCKELCFDSSILEKCSLCEKRSGSFSTFPEVKRLRDDAIKVVQSISSRRSDNAEALTEGDIEKLESAHVTLKRCCHLSSWYVQESGQVLVDGLLSQVKHHIKAELNNTQLCSRALVVLEEIVSHSRAHLYSPLNMIMNQLKIGKILLFLNPDPTRAIMGLQDVRLEFLKYYPNPDEEINLIVKETLLSAHQ